LEGTAVAVPVSTADINKTETGWKTIMVPRTLSLGVKLLVGLLLFDSTAFAQQPTQAQASAIRQSCRSDYQSYCAAVPTGGKAFLQCLQEHLSNLSPACQSAVSQASGGGAAPAAVPPPQVAMPAPPPPEMSLRQEAALMRRACGNDFHAYCADVPMGGGRALACLSRNETRLSPTCRNAMAEARAER
jgi:hypothetical protein